MFELCTWIYRGIFKQGRREGPILEIGRDVKKNEEESQFGLSFRTKLKCYRGFRPQDSERWVIVPLTALEMDLNARLE